MVNFMNNTSAVCTASISHYYYNVTLCFIAMTVYVYVRYLLFILLGCFRVLGN